MGLPKPNNTTKLALITFFSSLYLYGHIGTLYLQARGLTLLQASSMVSILIAAIFIAEVPTGVIADKIGRKKSVIVALSIQFLGEVLYLFAHSYAMFVTIAILAGVGFAFASGCVEALIYETLASKDRENAMKKAMGLKGAASYFAFFLAPVLGSILVPVFSIPVFLRMVAITAVSVFMALLISLTLEEPKSEYEHKEVSPLDILKKGVKYIRGNRKLLWLMSIMMGTATFSGTLGTLFQPYLESFGFTARHLGIASAVGALFAIVLQKNVYRIEQYIGKKLALVASIFLPSFGYMTMALAVNPAAALWAYILTQAVVEIKNPLMSSYQNQLIPNRVRTTVLSLTNMLVSAYVAGVGLIMGWLADINLAYPFILVSIFIAFFALILRVDKVAEAVSENHEDKVA